ncbi:Uma2 family endonuclease [Romeria aff. gracilis LEGE 07310]|uniref:Uma2 family endonuclease n=1 Tax=Vasconcelosia minhoensis LEGE 07310 TaxID=915328 RepID=A0A8J7AJJ4_9CYAN|nr:Uma2 family endonuclease [Romeria gracilis]MBE9076545.1 Uma2 family endonuclease [Romeria aff. gracilis LEGE 07310]
MVQTPSKFITLDEFLRLPETKPASEYINGRAIQKPMPKGQHSRIQQKLVNAINAVTEDAQIALALPELRCTFGDRSTVPDIAVFLWERLPTDGGGTLANAFTIAPDWTLEILSPEQSTTRVTSNIFHCLNYGCRMGWLIDPSEQLVQIYSPNERPISLESVEDRLPIPEFATGLQLTVGQLFGWLKVR